MTKPLSIFLFAGEPSGDLHGEKLVASLFETFPQAEIFGVGGPKMRAAGFDCILPMEKFQVMGFVDVLFALPSLLKHFLFLRNLLLSKKVDIVLFIDYPGFSLHLAKALFKRKFKGKICHYICPSVWAWGKGRIKTMEKILDCLFVIFPFEKNLFDTTRLAVHYVGNPLVGRLHQDFAPPIRIDPKHRVVAIFPGSREKELYRNFPIQLKVAEKLLKQHPDLFFIVSVANPTFSLLLDQLLRQSPLMRNKVMFVDASQNSAIIKRCGLAIAKSGTNNLELALHQVPTVVTYGIGPLDLFIAKNILKIKLPYYCIVNIIANTQVFPELIGPQFTEEALYFHTNQILSSKKLEEECREKCGSIRKMLEGKYPEQEIASALKNLLSHEPVI